MTTSLFNRIKPDQIADRLDGEYYAKELLENESKLNLFIQVTLENCVTNIRNAISDLTSNGSFEFLRGIQFNHTSGIPYVRTQNLMDGYIDFSDGIYVDLKCKDMVAKSLCETGDLIVCRKGKVGAASAVSADIHGAAISENVTRFRLDKSYDADFLATFLNSNHGRMRFLREATGVIQKWINNEKLRQIRVIRIDSSAEKYIGDKVRQAEKLRAWAKRLEVRLALLENKIPISKHVVREAKHSKATLSYLTENRLDARYYANKHLDLYAQFTDDFESLGTIFSKFKYGASIAANYVNTDGLPFIRGNALSPNRINKDDIVYLNRSLEDEGNNYCIEEDDILITRSGTVGVAAHVTSEYAKYWYGSFIIKCTLSNKLYLPAYVSWYLNSWVGQQQFRRLENGAVQLNINIEELSSIAIWKASQEFQNEIQQLLFEQISAVNLSKLLANTAKTLVEALIEGQLTEQQLIQAQQALEDGDNSLDQAILSKLSAEGYAIEGATPLFSDVDELYSLLEEAAQAEAEE
ncbi:restriction endonuclease subunit S [Pantoea agglomerans]|uniref:EcoKI restriction-modification system protein HsdS n=2 Tax=Pantoea TaxID=53335 RepID=A0A379AM66_ENTAG|nr:restriction endonuclease subunit S [Pantoea agglomerans]QXB58619.1 restriction endonuclease subunit S [Pantoea agglomerans]SUB18628.1 EcoKI restriction-modification system protein HsdS [Pantoea agglomerans]